MHLVVGLGNPGEQYQDNRHNLGFKVVDELRARARGPVSRAKFGAELCEVTLVGARVLLCKPMEFMNVSGQAVARVAGSPSPPRVNWVGSRCHWRSGACSDGRERLNPPASATFDVSGPECRYRQRAMFLGPAASSRPGLLGVCHMAVTAGWSDRFAPTPGLSA